MAMTKEAVDQKTKDYWSNYFKEYGEMWVRTIPRRIKSSLAVKLGAKEVDGLVAPLASDVSKHGVISVEAGFKGTVDGLYLVKFDTHSLLLNRKQSRYA